MEIVLLESLGIPDKRMQEYQESLEKQGHTFRAYTTLKTDEELIKASRHADIVMLANRPLSAQVITELAHCRMIDIAFTGYDHVALQAAKEKNICVCNASGYATQAVAELAVQMMLSLLRNVDAVQTQCRNEQTKVGLIGSELGSKTVGIIGMGKIGERTAALCAAFGAKILGYRASNKSMPSYVTPASLDDLLTQSDIVSLHCPLTESTRGLISKARIAQMKKTALLINTARGAIVDSQALADALQNGQIAAAGIDVFETEPPISRDHPLLHTPNTLVTPHIAFASQEAMLKRADIVFDNISHFIDGKPINLVQV